VEWNVSLAQPRLAASPRTSISAQVTEPLTRPLTNNELTAPRIHETKSEVTDSTITVYFNGKPMSLPSGTTISALLEVAEIRSKLVAVEVNMDIVPREQHAEFTVSDNDRVEAVTLVGGG
jgi:sulfur carrier protein